MHAVWKGTISFGLVAIPVQLFAATEERGVSFRQVHASDGGRIRYRRVCEVDGQEVGYGDIAKAYPLPGGEVVTFTDEDFASLPLASHRAIEVLSFVEADTIDPIQHSRCYYCEPMGADLKPYTLLREALERTGKVAMVKVALRQRESLAMLRPRDGVIVLQLLLWPDEVRKPSFTFLNDEVALRPQEVQIAETYVETLTGDVESEEMVDRYRVALEQVIEGKLAGRTASPPPSEPAAGPALDLMEALRRTVEEAQRGREPKGGEAAKGGGTPKRGDAAKGGDTSKRGEAAKGGETSKRGAAAKRAPAAKRQAAAEGTAATKRQAPVKAGKESTTKKTVTRETAENKRAGRSGAPASPR